MRYTITLVTTSTVSVEVDADNDEQAMDKVPIEMLREVPQAPNERYIVECHSRICSATKEEMEEGWVVGDGDEYFKYEKDALLYANLKGYKDLSEAYNDEFMYWTQF